MAGRENVGMAGCERVGMAGALRLPALRPPPYAQVNVGRGCCRFVGWVSVAHPPSPNPTF